MMRIVIGAVIGGGIGFAIGYFGRCQTGACPLTSNFYVSTIVGALIGGMLASSVPIGTPGVQSQSKNVAHLTDADFWEQIRGDAAPAIVDFYADYCPPCRQFAPTFAALADAYAGRVRFFKVDTQKNAQIAQELGVEAIPTIRLFKAGQPTGEPLVGLQQESTLRELLDKLLAG